MPGPQNPNYNTSIPLYPGGSGPGSQYFTLLPDSLNSYGPTPTVSQQASPLASASGLLEGAGETVEADPRGGGGFDLTARLFRDTGRLRTDVNNIKQVI